MKTGINFSQCNVLTAELHNARDSKYLEAVEKSGKKTYDIFHDRTNENKTWLNPKYSGKNLSQILDEARERYKEKVKQSPQEQPRVRTITDKKTGLKKTVETPGWSPIREGVCPVKEDTKPEDFFHFIEYLEKKGIHVIRIDIHVDEGYQDPVSGERKYNYHAHVIADWTDHDTGTTIKLTKIDTSEMQDELAIALQMERGESKIETGVDNIPHARYREKKAAEHAKELEEKNAELDKQLAEKQQALDAITSSYDKAKVDFRKRVADVGARIMNAFGRGAIAEAEDKVNKANARASAAEHEAEKQKSIAKQAFVKQEEAMAEVERIKDDKDLYGDLKFLQGETEGYHSGQMDSLQEIRDLKKELYNRERKLDAARRMADAKTNAMETLLRWNPHMKNWEENLKEMQAAKMSEEDILDVFMFGEKEDVEIAFEYYNTIFRTRVKVDLCEDNRSEMSVWFNDETYESFKEAYIKGVIQKSQSNDKTAKSEVKMSR